MLEDLSSPVGAFIRDRCVIGPDCSATRADLYTAYKNWCEDRGYTKHNAATFARNVYAAYPQIRRSQPRNPDGSRADIYLGIGLGTGGTSANPLYRPRSQSSVHKHPNALALVPPVPDDADIEERKAIIEHDGGKTN